MKMIKFICCLSFVLSLSAMDQEETQQEADIKDPVVQCSAQAEQVINDATQPCPLVSEYDKSSCCACRNKGYLERTMSADESCHMYVCSGCLLHSAEGKPDEGGYEGISWTWMFIDKFSCQTCGGEVSIRNRHNYRNF